MTEHAAMPPLMAALYLLVRREPSTRSCFLTGVLAGVATLVRLNLAYAALAVGAFVLFASVRRAPRTTVRHALACAAGGLLVLALVWLPYALSGQRELWWRAVVLAPLAHTGRNPSISQNLTAHSLRALGVYRDASGFAYVGLPVITFVWLAAMGGTVLLVVRRAAVGGDLRGVALLGLTTLGVGVGIIKSGSPHPHHVIQLAPLGAALAGVFLDWATGRRRVPAALIVFALMVTSSRVVAVEYQTIAERARAGQPLAHGAAFEIAAYLRRENPERRPVFLMSDNVAYWLSGVGPPSRMTTHFGTLHDPVVMTALTGRPTSTLDELQSVFQRRPKFVVASENVARLPTWAWVRRVVAEEYVTASRIADRIVYRRRADP
jgi:hypothetical protein